MLTSSQYEDLRAGLAALDTAIRDHDAALWQVGEPPFAKLRHIGQHLAKVTGKVAGVTEPLDHVADVEGDDSVQLSDDAAILADVAADLVIHAAQIANLADVGLGDALVTRWRRNAARFGPETEFASWLEAPERG